MLSCREQVTCRMMMAVTDICKATKEKLVSLKSFLLAFGLVAFKLPGDIQQDVGSVSSFEIDFGFNLCRGDS